MIFPNISIGRNTKRYTHNMSFDNNTTLPFGVVQPLMSQRLEPNAKISVNMRQLVRLAPMPVPTFARLNMVNEVCFVPTVDVCPYYEALVSQMSFTGTDATYYPTELPRTSNSFLVYYLLTQFDDVYYSAFDKSGNLVTDTSKLTLPKVQTALFNAFFGVSASTSGVPPLQEEFCQIKKDNFISVDAADYVVRFGDDEDDTTQFYLCFRLTESARRFRSVLVGLGYSLNASDHSSVSIIPILSYYKAWFDLYYPVRDLNWTDTNAYKVIKHIENYRTRFTEGYVKQYHVQAFIAFLRDLHNTFYTSKDDIVSVHRDTISLANGATPNIVEFHGAPNHSISKNDGQQPFVSKGTDFGLITLQALQRFTRYFAKNSVIGKRISSYVKVHYGAAVANSLYKDVNHIGSYSYPLSVDDVMSSSDTFDVSTDTAGNSKSSGELLGAYAGKGIGFDKSSFDFTAPTFGYFFVLSSVSTPTGYFQGNSGDLYVVDFDHVPNPDFDCLGYEISPRGQFISYNDIVFGNDDSYQSLHITDGFGFVPRYTGLKYHKNIVNGDISRRSTADSLSAYHLNRIITPFTLTQSSIDTSSSTIKVQIDYKSGDVPSASTAWRFLTRQTWLGDYNRIFYNHGDLYPADHWHGDLYGPDDNFIVQTVFDVRVTDQYKPLSQAWDTFEESTDDSSVDVKPE